MQPKENLFLGTTAKPSTSTSDLERYINDPSFKKMFENVYPEDSTSGFSQRQDKNEIHESENRNIEKTPQNFIKRYETEPDFRERFNKDYPNVTIEKAVGLEKSKIPQWVKNIFTSYLDNRTTDEELIDSIRFLINEGIIKV